MINDQSTDDIRGLFDWRSAAGRPEHDGLAAIPGIGNDDLALALQLLSCNVRDRHAFNVSRDGAAAAN